MVQNYLHDGQVLELMDDDEAALAAQALLNEEDLPLGNDNDHQQGGSLNQHQHQQLGGAHLHHLLGLEQLLGSAPQHLSASQQQGNGLGARCGGSQAAAAAGGGPGATQLQGPGTTTGSKRSNARQASDSQNGPPAKQAKTAAR